MKKVKIMLAAIIVLAIAGGVFAFKTKAFDVQLCINIEATPNTTDDTSFCPIAVEASFTDTDEVNVYATLKPITLDDCISQDFPNGLPCRGTYTTWNTE